jgi:hypothetical protein
VPCEVSAVKFGASSLMRNIGGCLLTCLINAGCVGLSRKVREKSNLLA